MEKPGGSCRCFKSKSRCASCKPGPALDLDAALQELGALNGKSDKQENSLRERRQNETKICFEQTPPLWINSSTSLSSNNVIGFPLRVDTEYVKDPPQQPPNSPVSPQLPYEQFRTREDPLPQRCEWDGRLLGGRRISMKGRQRMLSGPDGGNNDNRYSERMRDRNSWRPYRIPRPKLLNMGHCSRIRTISALLHEETDVRIAPILDTSPVATATDALRCMAIGEGLSKTLDNSECSMNFPRSRSAENLERRVMDVAATTLDVVSEKIEKLHVN